MSRRLRRPALLFYALLFTHSAIAWNSYSGIEVEYADYGIGGRYCNATPVFRAHCDGESSCSIHVGNDLCGDPFKGERKEVEVSYWCGGQHKVQAFVERTSAELRCDNRGDRPFLSHPKSNAPWGTIDVRGADYGTYSRSCDATESVQHLCNGQRNCRLEADNNLCGDPEKGARKSLQVTYFCGNNRHNKEILERESGTLSCPGNGYRPGLQERPGENRWPKSRGPRGAIFIQNVWYGIPGRMCNATAYFSTQCNNRSQCSVQVSNGICGDPAKGHRKRAEIHWTCRGRIQQVTVGEKKTANLHCDQ